MLLGPFVTSPRSSVPHSICSPLKKISPKAKRAKELERSRTSDPEPGAICESAVVAFLFLAREGLDLSFTDMHHLINIMHSSQAAEDLPLLPDLYEGTFVPVQRTVEMY